MKLAFHRHSMLFARALFTCALIAPSMLSTTAHAQRPNAEASRKQDDNAYVSRNGLECSPKPTQDEVNTAELAYQDYFLSSTRAASLGIPIVNASGASNYLVIVRDYRRFKPCTATDGKTILHYGQVIRAVIELTDYKADVKLTLALVAANATISGKQQYFYLYKTGWYNPSSDAILSSVSGKVFDVENYGLYQSVMPQLIGLLAQTQTTFIPQQIFRVPPEDDPVFV